MKPRTLLERYDLYQPSHSDMSIHWTGLAFTFIAVSQDANKVDECILAEIAAVTRRGEDVGLQRRWKEFKNALRFMDDFGEWIREKTYPKWHSRSDDQMTEWHEEHLELASQYLRSYEEGCLINPDDFTDKVPQAIHDLYRESRGLIKHVIESARFVDLEPVSVNDLAASGRGFKPNA